MPIIILSAVRPQKVSFKDVPIKNHINSIINGSSLSQFYTLQDFKNMIYQDIFINSWKLQLKQLIKRIQTHCLKNFQMEEQTSKQMLSALWPQFISDNMDSRQVSQCIKLLRQQLKLKNDHFGYLVGFSFQNLRNKSKEQGQRYIQIIDMAYKQFNISKSSVNYSFYFRKLFNDQFKDMALQCLSGGKVDQIDENQQYSYYSNLKQKFNDIYCNLSMKFIYYYEHFPMSQVNLVELINQCLKFIQNNYKSFVFETIIALFSINFIFKFIEQNQKLINPSDTLIYSIEWLVQQLMFLTYSQKYSSLMFFLAPEWITSKLFSKNLKGTIVAHLNLVLQIKYGSYAQQINTEMNLVNLVLLQRVLQVCHEQYQNIKLTSYTQQSRFFNQKISNSMPKVNATWSNSYIGNKSFKTYSNQNQKGSKTWDDNNEKLSPFNKQVNNFKSLLKQLNLHQICGRMNSLQKAYKESEQQSIKTNSKKDRFKHKYLFILLKIIATVSSQQKLNSRFSCKILAQFIQIQVMHVLKTMYQEEFIFKERIKQDYFNKILSLNSDNLKINSIIQYAQDHLINCQFKIIYKIRQIKSNLNNSKFIAKKNENASIIQKAIIQILQLCLNYTKNKTQLLYLEYLKEFLSINNQEMELTLFASVCFECFKKYGNMQQLIKKIKTILIKVIYILVISNKGNKQCQYFILHLHTTLKDFEHRELLNNFFQNTKTSTSSKSKNMNFLKQISPALTFFDILRKEMTINAMLVIAKKYKQLNSIINAIFFYQLVGYRIRQQRIFATQIKNEQKQDKSTIEQKRCQIEKKLKKSLLYCYSRVNTTFNNVKKVIGEQIGLSQNQMNFLSLIQKKQNYQGADIIQKYWTQTQKQYFQRKIFYMSESAHRKVHLPEEFYYNITITKACPFFAQLLKYNQDIQCLKICSKAMIVLLKIQLLKLCIYKIDSFSDKQEIQKISPQERQQSLIAALQRFTQNISKKELVDLYKFLLLVRPQNEYLRIKYMNLLIQIDQYPMFLKEIESIYGGKHYEQYRGSDLNLMVKYLYKIKNYEQCLLICKSQWIKQKNVNVLQIKIYQILANLSRNHSYTLQKVCFTFKQCFYYEEKQKFTQKHQKIKYIKQKHIKYVEIFHLIFDRFSFQSKKQNNLFLQLIQKYIAIFQIFQHAELIQYAKEITFILLRYIVEKFWEHEDTALSIIDKKNKAWYSQLGQDIIVNFKGIIPFLKYHSEYLIRKIGEQTDTQLKCNQIITTFLRQIAIQNPYQSSWWLYSLINHQYLTKQNMEQINKKSNKKNEKQLPQSSQFSKIGNYIKDELIERKKYKIDNNDWINYFVQCTKISSAKSQNQCNKIREEIIAKLNSIDHFLIMPFSPNLKIVKIKHIQRLGQGKSCPLKIFIECQSLQKQETIFYQNNKAVSKQINKMYERTIIMKYNKKQPGQKNQKNYMRQSNHANFFKQINLLGEGVTYNIIHLTRRLLLIQPIQYQYSLNELIQRQNKNEMYELQKIQKTQKNSMKIYDTYINKITLHRLFYDKVTSVEEWWQKINNYSQTTAFWSYIGICVGLGDRHGSNILINRKMQMIHIDFQYSLDFGLNLPYPEIVPFRLTKSVTSPMGLLKQYGIFYTYFIQAAKIMNFQRRKQLWRALSYFNSKNKEDKMIMQRIELKNFEKSIQQGCLQWIKIGTDPKLLRPMFIGWKGYL